MLPLCSVSAASPHSPIRFHVGARASFPLWKVIDDRYIAQDKSLYCLQDGVRSQDVSTHATKCMHSLVAEGPEHTCSLDSSIVSPYPNEFDNFAHGFSHDYFDTESESLSDSVGNMYRLCPINGEPNLNMSDTEVLHGEFGSYAANDTSSYGNMSETMRSSSIELTSTSSFSGNEFLNVPGTLGQSTSALYEPISASLSPASAMIDTIAEQPVAIPDTFEVTDKASNLKENVEQFLSRVNGSAGTQLDTAEGAVKSTYNTFISTTSDTIKSVKESFDNVVSGLFSATDNTKEQAADNLSSLSSKLQESISGAGILAADFLRGTIVTLEDSFANASTFVVYSYGSAKSLLPLNVKDALISSEGEVIKILRPVGAVFQQIYIILEGFEKTLGLDPSDPVVPFVLILGSSATIGASLWLFNYGGYSGDLAPEITLEMLKNDDNSVLIDVRPEDSRKRNGIPDLRRGARSKYACVTLPEIDGSMKKMLKGGKEIDNALIAVVIRNLKLVKDSSNVIVMDESGDRSKTIARLLKKLGVKKPYLVQGGFQSWSKKGLRIKELKPETALSVLNEEAEAILEDVKPTPTLVIGYILGISAAIYALLEWETTLQIIGIIGLGQTLYRRVASYEDSEDFKQDVRLLLAPVKVGAEAFTWVARRLEPNKLGLPTSPSSSAVQDRVLQAAAKHESQPSDSQDLSEA